VFPSGRARRIAEGTALVAPGGEPTEVGVDLGHAGYRLPPGHRLRLELAASGFPRYLPHPGTADDPWDPGRLQDTDQTVHLGGDAGSRLELTILPTTPGVSQ
jgi:predicted acyl esterase